MRSFASPPIWKGYWLAAKRPVVLYISLHYGVGIKMSPPEQLELVV